MNQLVSPLTIVSQSKGSFSFKVAPAILILPRFVSIKTLAILRFKA